MSAWTPHKDNGGVNGVHEYKSSTSEENLTRRVAVTDTSLFPCENLMPLWTWTTRGIQYTLILFATMIHYCEKLGIT